MLGFYIGVARPLVPKGTPKDITARLTGAVVEALADPRCAAASTISVRIFRHPISNARCAVRHHKAEIEKWWPIIKAANVKE